MKHSHSPSAETALSIGQKSFWVSPSQNTVYSLEITSPFAVPNYGMPYQLIVVSYSPTRLYYTEPIVYAGGIDVLGKIHYINPIDQTAGRLLGHNQIIWDNGQIWKRTAVPVNRSINPYEEQVVRAQAARDSDIFSGRYEAAYPNIYREARFN